MRGEDEAPSVGGKLRLFRHFVDRKREMLVETDIPSA
jgi:hypothetical protein